MTTMTLVLLSCMAEKAKVFVDTLNHTGNHWIPFVELAIAQGSYVVLQNYRASAHATTCVTIAEKYRVGLKLKLHENEAHFVKE